MSGLYLHSVELGSYSNGPGKRLVIWVQGCSIGCPGCWNPETHIGGGSFTTNDQLIEVLLDSECKGITFTGGEPFDQGESVIDVGISARRLGFTSVAFSGYTYSVLVKKFGIEKISNAFDVLLTDPYREGEEYKSVAHALSRKTLTFLSPTYKTEDFLTIPPCEVFIGTDGEVRTTGLAAPFRKLI